MVSLHGPALRFFWAARLSAVYFLVVALQHARHDVAAQPLGAAAQDCANLLVFYQAASKRGAWKNHTGWSDPEKYPDCCVWFGVTCHAFGGTEPVRVKTLRLPSNGLTGELAYSLSLLSRLEAIVLSDNVLRGNLYQTGFQNLVGEFRCQDNQPQVRYYALAAICSQDCGNPCTMVGGLRELRLDGNQLNGEIPEECARLYKTIKVMDISSNQLTGSIPDTIGSLTQLTELCLAFNQISGPIPEYIGLLTNLRFLNLAFNRLSGSIPSSIVNLARLEQLDLSVNLFHGPIPPDLGVLVSPPPAPCDRPGGTCFGATMRNMSLDDHGPCQPAEWVMWYVTGVKQPCNHAVEGSRYWCGSCDPPYPSLMYSHDGSTPPHASYSDCSDLPPAAPVPNMNEDYPAYPYAPAMPPQVNPVPPGPTLRLMVVPRCTYTPSVYAVQPAELQQR